MSEKKGIRVIEQVMQISVISRVKTLIHIRPVLFRRTVHAFSLHTSPLYA